MSATGPCRVCGIRMSAPDLTSLVCGPAWESLHAYREPGLKRNAKPGDLDYHPANDVQRARHGAALRKKQWV